MDTRFSCVGCGKCCADHHVPLTLAEAKQWSDDGGSVIVLIEAFLANGYGVATDQRLHATRRSYPVSSGSAQALVAITFAAYNAGRCRHLDAENLCGIYERRPLVCRIYPMEINPHIPLRPQAKDCPPEAWEQGPELIVGNQLVDDQLLALIEASKQADRDDIAQKQAICIDLQMNVTALKGNGFVAYLPDMGAFAGAIERVSGQVLPAVADDAWRFKVAGESAAQALIEAGARLETHDAPSYLFIPLHST